VVDIGVVVDIVGSFVVDCIDVDVKNCVVNLLRI
jgi:hypothetical protein